METFQKIETLYKFDSKTRCFIENKFTNPIVEYLKDCKWVGSEKIDGTNIRVAWTGFKFEIYGREDTSDIPKEIIAEYERIFNKEAELIIEQKFNSKQVIFCMEGYGGKVQRGTYSCSESLIGFDIMINGRYIDRFAAREIYLELGAQFVNLQVFNTLQDAINFVRGNPISAIDEKAHIEGLVCLPKERLYNNKGERIAVKIKVRDLLKTKKEL